MIVSMNFVTRDPASAVSNQVRKNPGRAATEDGERLEDLDIESRRVTLSM